MNVYELQRKLLSVVSPSGFESDRAEIIKDVVGPYVDEVFIDNIGNLVAVKRGSGKKIMLSAHMDTLGIIVKRVDDKGFVWFEQIGSSFPHYLMCTPVKFQNGIKGTICRAGKVTDTKDIGSMQNKDLYVDIGAKDRAEAEGLLKIGDYATVDLEPRLLAGNNMTSPYCDDLTGCIALIEAMMEAGDTDNEIYYVFSVQEELRLGGATVASFHLEPDIAIAVDVTLAGDAPEKLEENDAALGKGPVVIIKDNSLVCTPFVVDRLCEVAKNKGIMYQREVIGIGGTDASVIQRSRNGVLSGVLSIPMRYLHLPCETVNMADVTNTGRLLAAFVCENFGGECRG